MTHFCHIHLHFPFDTSGDALPFPSTPFCFSQPHPTITSSPNLLKGRTPSRFSWPACRSVKRRKRTGKLELVPDPCSRRMSSFPVPSPGSLRFLALGGVFSSELAEFHSLRRLNQEELCPWCPLVKLRKHFPGAAVMRIAVRVAKPR